MQLIARISVRRHLIEGERELEAGQEHGKSVAIFRVLGRSPEHALKVLAKNTLDAPPRSSVALTFASDALSADQTAVCKAIIAHCRGNSTEIVLCGRAPRPTREGGPPAGFGNSRWFASVQEMVQQFGKEEPRNPPRGAGARAPAVL